MESKKLGQEPAFPTSEFGNTLPINAPQQGMSKRFYAACAAMQGILSGMDCQSMVEYRSTDTEGVVSLAYMMADELLKQENESNQEV